METAKETSVLLDRLREIHDRAEDENDHFVVSVIMHIVAGSADSTLAAFERLYEAAQCDNIAKPEDPTARDEYERLIDERDASTRGMRWPKAATKPPPP